MALLRKDNNCIHSRIVMHMVIVTNIIMGLQTYQILPSDIIKFWRKTLQIVLGMKKK